MVEKILIGLVHLAVIHMAVDWNLKERKRNPDWKWHNALPSIGVAVAFLLFCWWWRFNGVPLDDDGGMNYRGYRF